MSNTSTFTIFADHTTLSLATGRSYTVNVNNFSGNLTDMLGNVVNGCCGFNVSPEPSHPRGRRPVACSIIRSAV